MPNTIRKNSAPPTDAPMITALCCSKKDPSGLANLSTLFGSCDTLGGFSGSKQYCLKHFVQKSERGTAGESFILPRSTAAHWKHLGQSGSGESVSGLKPPMVFAWT